MTLSCRAFPPAANARVSAVITLGFGAPLREGWSLGLPPQTRRPEANHPKKVGRMQQQYRVSIMRARCC
jgi:hypothetical protein